MESIGIDGKTEKLITYTYKEAHGRLKQITYANGHYMQATYNSVGHMIAEKWYGASDNLIAHYKYAYDGQGNIVRSIDMTALKEYNYIYEEGKLARAVEYNITVDSNEFVIGKSIVHTIRYTYDQEGNLTRKQLILANGNASATYYEHNDGNTVVKYTEGVTNVTCHSKTDSFGRKVFDELQFDTGFLSRQYSYHAGEITQEHKDNGKLKSTPVTQLVSRVTFADNRTLDYEYDAEERITKVTDSLGTTTEYTYDALGQLLTETVNGTVVNTMTYDNYGNILTKNGVTYTYGDGTWKDVLTGVGDETSFTDQQGNPLYYFGHGLTWEKGRQLKSFDSVTYTYNANGIRTSKTLDGVKHTYTLDGTKILRYDAPYVTEPIYDNEDDVCGLRMVGHSYFFQKNLQGDVIGITDWTGKVLVRYSYDAWGVCTIAEDTSGFNLGNINPFRYRSYFYDPETGLYYLQSRYYDPATGRFINADEPGLLSVLYDDSALCNLFNYCASSPVVLTDVMGYFPNIKKFLSNLNKFLMLLFCRPLLLLRSVESFVQSKTVTVIMAKDDPNWYDSSKTMGKNLRKAVGALGVRIIKVNSSNFLFEWKRIRSNYVIIHTHGAPNGLYGAKGAYVTVNDAQKIPRNKK